MSPLVQQVVFKCQELGPEKAASFFGVAPALVKQWVKGSKQPSLAAVEKVFEAPEAPAIEADWAGKDVHLCLPQYKSTNPLTLFSLLGIWDREKMGALMEYGDAFIVHARESLAEAFIKSGKPHSLWVDDDMIVPNGNAEWFRKHTLIPIPDEFAGLHTGNRLRSHEKALVGALYFGRKPWGRAMYYDAMVDSPAGAEENKRAHTAPFNALKPTKWVGTGCLWVNREVFLDIQSTHPHLAPMFPGEPFHYFSNASDGAMLRFDEIEGNLAQAKTCVSAEDNRPKAVAFLEDALRLIAEARSDNVRTAHLMQGEDQTFGIRAGKAGHQSYVDMGLICGHVGTCVYGPHNTQAVSPRHAHN